MQRKSVVKKIVETIRNVEPDAEIILFGSEARGDAAKESDIDILVLIDREILSYSEKQDITYPLFELELETGVFISPIVKTKKEWTERPFKTPFYINVSNDGILL